MTSSLSGEVYSLKVGCFLFGSPVSASDVSMPIFEINSTEDNTKISTPMLSGSGKNAVSFGSLAATTSPKIRSGGFSAYYITSRSGGLMFG